MLESLLRWKYKYYLAASMVFVVGMAAGLLLRGIFEKNTKEDNTHQIRQSGFKYINPLLECEVGSLLRDEPYLTFKEDIENLISKKTNEEKAEHVAVYFRDLNNGPWFGINQDEKYTPASLMKVPLLIAYYYWADKEPEVLNKKLVYQQAVAGAVRQNFKPSEKLESGKEYTVEELLHVMIKYSDNDAAKILLNNIDPAILNKTYPDLGLQVPDTFRTEDVMSVVSYASFFRILYNASYLSRNNSEKALGLLGEVDFKEGLVAGVPGNIAVSHKFGEREIQSANGRPIRQLHDCGVVYYPDRPYLLCIMSRGDDFKELQEVIRSVSDLVFREIDKVSPR